MCRGVASRTRPTRSSPILRTPGRRELAVLGVAYLLYSVGRFVAIGDMDVRPHYALLRDTVLATWLIALPIYALFPCAPPRLADVGLVDTITTQTGLALDSKLTTSFYNPIAAVPSLHAGFAIAVSAALAAAATRRSLRLLAWMWAPAVCLAVVATGDHFVTDIAAGAVVTVLGYVLGRAASRLAAGERPPRQFRRWRRAGDG